MKKEYVYILVFENQDTWDVRIISAHRTQNDANIAWLESGKLPYATNYQYARTICLDIEPTLEDGLTESEWERMGEGIICPHGIVSLKEPEGKKLLELGYIEQNGAFGKLTEKGRVAYVKRKSKPIQ